MFCLASIILVSGCAYFNTYYNAKKLFNQADRNRSGFPDTLVAGGSEAGLFQKSFDKFARVMAKYPQSRWAAPSLYHMAEAAYRRGEYPKAQGLYQDVWTFYPSTKYAVSARLGFALSCWRMGEIERAKRALMSLSSADSKTQDRALFLTALINQTSGNMAEAALQWEGYLYQHPKSPLANQARLNRARCLAATGDFNEAVSALQKLLSKRLKKSLRIQARLLLASAMEKSGRTQEALAVYRLLEKTALDPIDQRTVALSIVRMKAASEETPQARSLFRQLAAKYPRTEASAEAYYSMAEFWEQENALDSAQAYYTLARQENPSGPVAEDALRAASDIAMLQALGNQQTSEKTREQNAAIQYLMAEHYLFQLIQPDQALERFWSVYSNYPDLPIAAKSLYATGWVQLNAKADTASADSIFSLLVDRYPRTRYANGAREILGIPVDTTIADLEPEIALTVPIAAPLDTAKTLPAPQSAEPEEKKMPEEPGFKPETPKQDQGNDDLIKGLK